MRIFLEFRFDPCHKLSCKLITISYDSKVVLEYGIRQVSVVVAKFLLQLKELRNRLRRFNKYGKPTCSKSWLARSIKSRRK